MNIVIYSMSYKGQVFYIGKSKRLEYRKKEHIKKDSWCNSNHIAFVKMILSNGELPDYNILYHCTNETAKEAEIFYIKACVEKGIKLTNVAHNPRSNRIIIHQ